MLDIIAIDQGTTSTRTLTVSPTGETRIAQSLRHGQTYPQEGWVEQDATEILANIRACLAAAGPARCIGLSNQGESCLAWDSVTLEPLSPIITWQDSRTGAETEQLAAAGNTEKVRSLTGLPLDPYFSASKLAWLVANNPRVAAALAAGRLHLGTTDAFYLENLTGQFATDISTASRTSLMNIATGQWDPALCALFRVPIDCLPEIRPTTGDFGSCNGIPVTAAIVDQQAALYGHGCRKPGDTKITFGTGAFCLIIADGLESAMAAEGGLLPTVAWDLGTGAKAGSGNTAFALDGGVYDAGSAVEWALKAGLATSLADFDGFDAPPAIGRGLIWVPAFSGLACPFWDRSASPLMLGMTPETTVSDMRQALVEGIALLTIAILDLAGRTLPLSERISVDGGLTRSRYFCQFLADMSGRTITIPAFDELTALGTAALAAHGKGLPFRPVFAESEQHFTPRAVDRDRLIARFMQVVERCRGWRDA